MPTPPDSDHAARLAQQVEAVDLQPHLRRLVAAKGVQHQKRVQAVLQILGQHPGEFDAGAI